MYIGAEGAGSFTLFQMVLLWSIWAAAENGASNSQSHLQTRRLGIEASFQRAKEIGIGSRHEMVSRDLCLKHTCTHIYVQYVGADMEHVSLGPVTYKGV